MMNRPRMQSFTKALAAVLGIVTLTTVPAGADQYSDLVKRGKESFSSQCLNCHKTLDEAAAGYRTKSSWQVVVADMVVRGARLDEGQQAAVVEYLSGRMLLLAHCRSCHTIQRPLTANKSFEDWKSTIERMAQRMPPNLGMKPEAIVNLSVYLVVERPPP